MSDMRYWLAGAKRRLSDGYINRSGTNFVSSWGTYLNPVIQSENEVTELPKGFNHWVVDNKERIKATKENGTLSYFLKDNKIESFVQKNNISYSLDSLNYLKAYTAKGGEAYTRYQKHDTALNLEKFIEEARLMPKLNEDIVWRKIWVSEQKWEDMFNAGYVEDGNIIELSKALQSATREKVRSSTFGSLRNGSNSQGIRYEIVTKNSGVVDIAKYSIYPEEQECLILPNQKFRVLSWGYKNGTVEIKIEEIKVV